VNILYTNFHSLNGGGHTTYIVTLAKALSKEHRISIATPDTSQLYAWRDALPDIAFLPFDFKPRIAEWATTILHLRKLIVAGKFDIIHVNGSADHRFVMLACALIRKRPVIVFTKHNEHRACSIGNAIRARFFTDHTIAVSDYVKTFLANSAYRKVSVVKHGIDLDAGHHPELARQWKGLRDICYGASGRLPHLVLGSTAGTGAHKGWMTLANALVLLRPEERARLSVVLAGELPCDLTLATLDALDVRRHFHFTGLITDKNAVLGCSDMAFVLSQKETLSYACREAMAAGLPVMVAASGGLLENVDDGINGWVVPPGDAAAVAGVLRQILNDPDHRLALGRAARSKSVAQFGMEGFLVETMSVYHCAIAARGKQTKDTRTSMDTATGVSKPIVPSNTSQAL